MGIWGWLTGDNQIAHIDWNDASAGDVLVHRATPIGAELKLDGRLHVRDGQVAVFVSRGQVLDPVPAGDYTLSEKNLSSLLGNSNIPVGRSGVKLDVYFVSIRSRSDINWGGPVTMKDATFGPVRARVAGSCSFTVAQPAKLLREVLTGDGFANYTVSNLRNIIAARFADAFRGFQLPIRDLVANYKQLTRKAGDKVAADLLNIGVSLSNLLAHEVVLPPEIARVLDRVSEEFSGEGSASEADPLHFPPPPASGPNSARLPLVAAAPASTAYQRSGNNSPRSGRILLTDMGPESGIYRSLAAEPSGRLISELQRSSGERLFHVAVNGSPTGPYDLEAMRAQVQGGMVTPHTMIWLGGSNHWVRAEKVPELAPLFAQPSPLTGTHKETVAEGVPPASVAPTDTPPEATPPLTPEQPPSEPPPIDDPNTELN